MLQRIWKIIEIDLIPYDSQLSSLKHRVFLFRVPKILDQKTFQTVSNSVDPGHSQMATLLQFLWLVATFVPIGNGIRKPSEKELLRSHPSIIGE